LCAMCRKGAANSTGLAVGKVTMASQAWQGSEGHVNRSAGLSKGHATQSSLKYKETESFTRQIAGMADGAERGRAKQKENREAMYEARWKALAASSIPRTLTAQRKSAFDKAKTSEERKKVMANLTAAKVFSWWSKKNPSGMHYEGDGSE
jgi:hypothetical protein